MSEVGDQVKVTIEELLKAISTKNVISEPIEVGDNVVITITKVGLGFGTGKGESRGTGPQGMGSGVGGAAGVAPVAVIVFHKSTAGPEGVEVKSLSPPSGIGKAMGEIATSVVQGMSERRAKKEQEKTQQ
jgi:uncharacterized spore protein YtfJ